LTASPTFTGTVTAPTINSGSATSLVLQSNGTTGVTLDTSQNATFVGTVNMASSFLRNRIINGNMVIDQRNAGASVTPANNTYTLDRWKAYQTTASKFSVQQNAASVALPAGYTNYLGVTSLSAYTVATTDFYTVQQVIEGYNISDLAWGTAAAKTVTLSFLVYSSLTGTFGGSLFNSAGTRSYPFNYSIASANTWTTISVTIPGDSTGSWLTGTNAGIQVAFGLGAGSTYTATANAWAAGLYTQPTSTVSVVGTSGATFYITGVQLEQGSVATPFERPLYSKQLADCQRYYQMSYDVGTAPGTSTNLGLYAFGVALNGATTGPGSIPFKVNMRAAPTISYWDGAGNASKLSYGSAGSQTNNVTPSGAPTQLSTTGFAHPGQAAAGNVTNWIHYAASAEL
jgi:hypothetical protein